MAEYQFQIDAGYAQNREHGVGQSRYDLDVTTLSASFFFQPVATENAPVRLAPFVMRSSSVSVGGQIINEPYFSDARNRTFHGAAIDAQIGETPLRLGAGWSRAGGLGFQHRSGRPEPFDVLEYSIAWHLLENGRVSYSRTEYEREEFSFLSAELEFDAEEWRYRQVVEADAGWFDFSIFHQEETSDRSSLVFNPSELEQVRYGAEAYYYPGGVLGIGLSLSQQESDFSDPGQWDEKLEEVGIAVTFDPSEAVGFSAFYVHGKTKLEREPVDIFNVFSEGERNERLVGAAFAFRF